ncbi:MAG: 3D domain-containing protein [Clostridiaceae bacterium]
MIYLKYIGFKEDKIIEKIRNFLNKAINKKNILFLTSAIILVVIVSVVLVKRKPISLSIDGDVKNIVTYQNTVAKTLEKEKIALGPKDYIQPSLDTELNKNDKIIIKRAVNVNVVVDGEDLEILSSEDTIATMFSNEKIEIDSDDKITPSVDTKLSEGLDIQVIRVEEKEVEETSKIDFSTETKYDGSLANTKNYISQEGNDGEKKITYDVVYEDGVEVSREKINEEIVEEPVNKIIVQGSYPLMPVSRGGDVMSYSSVKKVKATAYWAVYGVGSTYTASGRLAVRDPDGYSTIAVDPRVIPYGTKLFIEGYGFAIAADCGSAIKNDKIDVYFNTYQEACDWAVKYVNLYILN